MQFRLACTERRAGGGEGGRWFAQHAHGPAISRPGAPAAPQRHVTPCEQTAGRSNGERSSPLGASHYTRLRTHDVRLGSALWAAAAASRLRQVRFAFVLA